MNKKVFKVYKSSAGSGKTTTLVQEYLKITLANPSQFKHIIAITFTNKATEEMKSRIVSALEELSAGRISAEYRPVFDELSEQKQLSEEELILNAQLLLSNILHSYAHFAISTIDSFVLRIVRSFAYDLHLPLNFGIELEEQVIIDELIALLLEKAGYDDRLTQHLVSYIQNQADKEKNTHIPALLASLAKIHFNEKYSAFSSELEKVSLDDLYNTTLQLKQNAKLVEKKIKRNGELALKLIQDNQLSEDDFRYKMKGPYGFFVKMAHVENGISVPGKNVRDALEDDKWYSATLSSDLKHSIDSIKVELARLALEVLPWIEEYQAFLLLLENVDSILLLKYLQEMLQGFYEEEGIIHLSETLKRISDLVENEQAPFIYERIGNQFNNYLIDEFQDTSVRQWHNLLPLVEEALAENHFNLVVGDAKQAIYRWRGGDFQQFIDLPQIPNATENPMLLQRQTTLQRNFQELELDTNYRSSKEVVSFNNALFSWLRATRSDNDYIQKVFSVWEQKVGRKLSGKVEINFIPPKKEDEDAYEKALEAIILDLKNTLASKGFSWSQVVFLARSNANLLPAAELLLKHDIEIVASQSLKLIHSPHIRFLIHFMQWLHNPKDEIAAYSCYQYLQAEGKFPDNSSLSNAFHGQRPNLSELLGLLDLSYEAFDKDNPAQIVEYLSSQLGIYQKDYSFIMRLLDFILDAAKSVGVGLAMFLEYFELMKNKLYVDTPKNPHAANLMTIHKSKGLGFKMVVLLEPAAGNSTGGDFLMVSPKLLGINKPDLMLIRDKKQVLESVFSPHKLESEKLSEADELNVFYVACTRAASELYILSQEGFSFHNDLKSLAEMKSQEDKLWTYDERSGKLKIESDISPEFNHTSSIDLKQKAELTYNHFSSWQRHTLVKGDFSNHIDSIEREAIDWGDRVHLFMSGVKFFSDFELEFEKLNANANYSLGQKNEIRRIINSVAQHEELKALFQGDFKVYNERNLMGKAGKVFRPDRVLVLPSEVVIIDYKYSNPMEIGDKQSHGYVEQLENYKQILQEIYPQHRVKAAIFWLKGDLLLQWV